MRMSSERAIDRCRDAWHAAGLVWQDRTGDTADAQAPGHSPADRSVTFRQIEGQVLVNSHADDKIDVLTAVGLTVKDLFDEPSGRTDTYPDGRIVHRSPDKKFRQSGNTKGRSLFRTEFADAAMVYVCEGEKDVRAVESVGAAATCSAMGAGKAHLFNWEPLRGKNVTVVADKDEPGRKHAAQVAELLDGIATSVRVMEAAEGKDAADEHRGLQTRRATGHRRRPNTRRAGAGVRRRFHAEAMARNRSKARRPAPMAGQGPVAAGLDQPPSGRRGDRQVAVVGVGRRGRHYREAPARVRHSAARSRQRHLGLH